MSRNPLPVKNPKKEYQADLNASFMLDLSLMISPTNAPKNGPARIPKKFPVQTPKITPTVEPMEPDFEPPDFFVKNPGTKLFRISTATVRIPKITNAGIVTWIRSTKNPSISAPQHKGVPGIPGTIQPMIPTINKTTPKAIKTISLTAMI